MRTPEVSARCQRAAGISAMLRVLLLVAVAATACDAGDGCPSGTVAARIDTAELCLELAPTPAERTRGLMHRRELPADRGMLFVFPRDTRGGFWMKDTYVPLSIAFLDEERTIRFITQMEPESLESQAPPSPYRYALEVNRGWFEQHSVEVGDRVSVDLRRVEPR